MSQIVIPEKDAILTEVLAAYDFPETLLGAARYGQGHINDTFCIICQPPGRRYNPEWIIPLFYYLDLCFMACSRRYP